MAIEDIEGTIVSVDRAEGQPEVKLNMADGTLDFEAFFNEAQVVELVIDLISALGDIRTDRARGRLF